MKKNMLLIFVLVANICYSQHLTKDKIEIIFVKSRLASNSSITRDVSITNSKLKKVMIKLKIKSKSMEKAKLSAFSLIDTKNKIRYRLVDYLGYKGFFGFPESIPFRKTEIYNKKGEPIDYGPPYDKTEKDYFNDYDMEGYFNFEVPINFGNKTNPKNSILYFGETRYSKFKAELFFAIPTENTNLTYKLYYKDEKIKDITF